MRGLQDGTAGDSNTQGSGGLGSGSSRDVLYVVRGLGTGTGRLKREQKSKRESDVANDNMHYNTHGQQQTKIESRKLQ